MGVIDRVERRAGQVLLGAMFIKLGFDAARDPGPRVDRAAALGVFGLIGGLVLGLQGRR